MWNSTWKVDVDEKISVLLVDGDGGNIEENNPIIVYISQRAKKRLGSDDDVVDWDVDELDEESNESHDGESDRGGRGDLLVFCKKKWGKSDKN